ncbi:MAG: hypothetical protein R3F59_21345 [Myxococcota bacterium]
MAFKMRCPKCFGLDYSVERDNRTFGAVAQAFELVFHCRCGKQLFGEQLLKEYEQQKKDFEARGETDTEEPSTPARRRADEELAGALARRAAAQAPASSDDDDDEDEDRKPQDKRWKQRMAALEADDSDDDDVDDDSPDPAPTRGRSRTSTPAPAADAAPKASRAKKSTPSRAKATKAPKSAAPEPEDEGEDEDESDDDVPEKDDPAICAWPGCTNPRRPNSKYCSRACSNKNARNRHKSRNKKVKKGDLAA